MMKHKMHARKFTIRFAAILFRCVVVLLTWSWPASVPAASIASEFTALDEDSIVWPTDPAVGSYGRMIFRKPISGETLLHSPSIFSATQRELRTAAASGITTDSSNDVPLPASFLLFGSGLIFVAAGRRFWKA